MGGDACIKMLGIKKQLRKDHIFTSDELPVQIPAKKTVHNTFTCPILRAQATENNPPMRLLCGHVISKDALTKLSQPNRFVLNTCFILTGRWSGVAVGETQHIQRADN